MAANQEILDHLKESGYRFTGKRKAVVDLFIEYQDKYLTAKEVYEHMKKSYPSISYDTIYRTLALLQQLQVIEEMEFGDNSSKYRLSCGHAHHHHLVCLGCGSIQVVHDCPMRLININEDDFMVVDHRFEISGYCSNCRHIGRDS